MNRPRNRQPRRGLKTNGHQGVPSRHSPATPQQAAGTVPSLLEVVPGASVFIILKEDQPTGKETAGVVSEVLTRHNHPRGIKVRLRTGQVGRVQRLGNASALQTAASGGTPGEVTQSARFSHRYTDVRNDVDCPSEPPSRSLADFFPPVHLGATDVDLDARRPIPSDGVTVHCPFCDSFEGDETAVTHHIEREHLT